MPARNLDLHGFVPDRSASVLVLIDVINDFAFPEGDRLLRSALPAARRIAALSRRARQNGIPVVYVNDNFGRWRSSLEALVAHGRASRGREVVDCWRRAATTTSCSSRSIRRSIRRHWTRCSNMSGCGG